MWHFGSGKSVTFEEVLKEIIVYSTGNGIVFIGCDSQIIRGDCIFSTAICMHGADNQKGGYYFFIREKLKRNDFPNLILRLLKEVEKSINMGYKIMDSIPTANIEIHIDANSKRTAATGKYIDMLTGYVRASGFDFKIKPEAWASNSVADKHSK